jgi:four helix bundle protein
MNSDHENTNMMNRTNTNTNTLNRTNMNKSTSTSTSTSAAAAPRFENRFIALDVSYELIEALRPPVSIIGNHNRSLADQIFRAASSVPANLAEGQRSEKGNKHKHYAIAHGSANEVKAALYTARAWGWIDSSDRALAVMDRLLALLWRLTHPRRG